MKSVYAGIIALVLMFGCTMPEPVEEKEELEVELQDVGVEEAGDCMMVSENYTYPGGDYDIELANLEAHGKKVFVELQIWNNDRSCLEKMRIETGDTVKWTSFEGNEYLISVLNVTPGYTFSSKWAVIRLADIEEKTDFCSLVFYGEELSDSRVERLEESHCRDQSNYTLRIIKSLGFENITEFYELGCTTERDNETMYSEAFQNNLGEPAIQVNNCSVIQPGER